MIDLNYINVYHIADFSESQNKNNDRNYLRDSKIENTDTSEQSDDYEINNENTTEQNTVTASEFDNSDDKIIVHFTTVKVIKSHIYKDCQQAFSSDNLFHKHIH